MLLRRRNGCSNGNSPMPKKVCHLIFIFLIFWDDSTMRWLFFRTNGSAQNRFFPQNYEILICFSFFLLPPDCAHLSLLFDPSSAAKVIFVSAWACWNRTRFRLGSQFFSTTLEPRKEDTTFEKGKDWALVLLLYKPQLSQLDHQLWFSD